MPTIETLVVTQPPLGAGIQVPYAGVHPMPSLFGPWRFVVEVAVIDPNETAWSVATWGPDDDSGTAIWEDEDTGYSWVDITADVRGITWTRGADEAYGAPRTGTATLQLDNQTKRYSPWSLDPVSPFVAVQQVLGPGTVIRWGYRRSFPTDENFVSLTWRPQFLGIVEFWDTDSEGSDADQWADIPLVEITAFLANIDEPARTAVGGSEPLRERLNRLTGYSTGETGWPFGAVSIVEPLAYGTMLATTMAGNRLTEVLLSVASQSGVDFGVPIVIDGDRQGLLTVRWSGAAANLRWDKRNAMGDGDPQTKMAVFAANDLTVDQQAVIPGGRTAIVAGYPADALKRRSTHDSIVNWCSIAETDNVASVVQDTTSIALYGRRTFQRHDFINEGDLALSKGNQLIIERSQPHPEISPFTVYADTSPGTWDVITVSDSMENAVVFGHTASVALLCRIRTITHRVLPHPDGLLHEADFTLDVIDELEAGVT